MKTNSILFIIILLMGFYIFNSYIQNRNAKHFLEIKNTELQKNIDSLKKENSKISDKILVLDSINNINQNKIELIKDSLTNSQTKTDEKINVILNYSDDELKEFFTNRYGNNAVK